MNHKSLGRMQDISPAVLVANELVGVWPLDRPLEFIHVPFAAAEEPPTFERPFYERLRELRIPASTRFVAGCIHETLSPERQVELLRLIESRAGREVERRGRLRPRATAGTSPQAWDAMEKALLLVR